MFFGALACAQCLAAYPDKPIRIVTPFPAGSVTDIIARPLAAKLTEAWGASVIVDNRGGAGGSPQYTIDLITGRIELAFASIAPAIPHVRSG